MPRPLGVLIAVLSVPVCLLLTGVVARPAHAAPVQYQPPFIDHTQWVHRGDLSSLQVYPTPSGRSASGIGARADGDEAWTEVLASAPDADTPGMREQFMCHWQLAELGQPGKTSWNLEPWRPVVDPDTMVNSGCNPGGSEEPS